MVIKNLYNYGSIIEQVKGNLLLHDKMDKISEEEIKMTDEQKEVSFHHLIQYPESDKFLQRLHQLIDGSKGADVGCVLLHCKQNNWLKRVPTEREFCSEFNLLGKWKSVQKYMNENNLNALSRANQVMFF